MKITVNSREHRRSPSCRPDKCEIIVGCVLAGFGEVYRNASREFRDGENET